MTQRPCNQKHGTHCAKQRCSMANVQTQIDMPMLSTRSWSCHLVAGAQYASSSVFSSCRAQSQYLANLILKINVKCGGRNVLLSSEYVPPCMPVC